MKSLNELSKEVHENAVAHGWWDEERAFGEIIALCHSELSEALEEYRKNKPMFYRYCYKEDCEYCNKGVCQNARGMTTDCREKKAEGIATELADCIIRILDYCGKEDIDIDEIIAVKMAYNKTRPYKHGGKRI